MDQDRDQALLPETPSSSPKLLEKGSDEALDKLYQAICQAMGEFSTIVNEATGQMGHRAFKYADLETLIRSTRPALTKYGVAVVQPMSGPDEYGNHRITTIVRGHGAAIYACVDYRRAGDLKEWGKQTTYIRRYAFRGFFQLDGSDDADNDPIPEERPRQNAQPTPPTAPQQSKSQAKRVEAQKPEAKGQPTPPAPPAKPAAPAPEPAQNGAPAPAAPAAAPEAPAAPRPASVPPPLPETIPTKEVLVAEMQTYLDPKSAEARRPQWTSDGKLVEEPHFTAENLQTWCVSVIGKGTKATTDEEKYRVILPALRALPKRQQQLPGTP